MTMMYPGGNGVAGTLHAHVDISSELARWLAEQMAKRVTRVMLAQRVGDNGLQQVDEWPTTDLVDAHALAQMIFSFATREAQSLRASLAYVVFGLRDDRPEPVGRFSFRIEASMGWMQSADAPDERGLTAMLMRHTEAATRLSLGHSREMSDQYERLITLLNEQHAAQLDKAYKRIEILEGRELEALELREKIQSMAYEREVTLAEGTRRDEMQKYRFEKVMGLVTLIAAKFRPSGAVGAPDGAGAAKPAANEGELLEVLTHFVQSVTKEQLDQLVMILRPEQLAMLSTLWDAVSTRVGAGDGTPAAATSTTTDSAAAEGSTATAGPVEQEKEPR
jgi:hypothetical protein